MAIFHVYSEIKIGILKKCQVDFFQNFTPNSI